MFTGIVQDILTITSIRSVTGGRRVTVTLPKIEQYQLGDSILLNGICSTVVAVDGSGLAVEYMAQTDRRTTSELWQTGDQLNCEAPLTLQTKISGSLVTGHVDCTGIVASLTGAPDDKRLVVAFAEDLPTSVIPQGCITIDGVNLTVIDCSGPAQVAVNIIPHTWQHTIMQYYRSGKKVNIEFDYIAKLFVALKKF